MNIETLEALKVGTKVVTNKGAVLTVTHNSRHAHADEHGRDRNTGVYYHGINLASADGKVISFRTRALNNGQHTVDPKAAAIAPQMEVL
jgi:hypothetical protein